MERNVEQKENNQWENYVANYFEALRDVAGNDKITDLYDIENHPSNPSSVFPNAFILLSANVLLNGERARIIFNFNVNYKENISITQVSVSSTYLFDPYIIDIISATQDNYDDNIPIGLYVDTSEPHKEIIYFKKCDKIPLDASARSIRNILMDYIDDLAKYLSSLSEEQVI